MKTITLTLITLVLIAGIIWAHRTHPAGHAATVKRVRDGDTITVETPTRFSVPHKVDVRILGIDTPEFDDPGWEAARQHLDSLLRPGDKITLILDPTQARTDVYGRILAYVQRRGTDVGERMIRDGYARAWWPRGIDRPQRAGQYLALEREAKQNQLGLWGTYGHIGKRNP